MQRKRKLEKAKKMQTKKQMLKSNWKKEKKKQTTSKEKLCFFVVVFCAFFQKKEKTDKKQVVLCIFCCMFFVFRCFSHLRVFRFFLKSDFLQRIFGLLFIAVCLLLKKLDLADINLHLHTSRLVYHHRHHHYTRLYEYMLFTALHIFIMSPSNLPTWICPLCIPSGRNTP